MNAFVFQVEEEVERLSNEAQTSHQAKGRELANREAELVARINADEKEKEKLRKQLQQQQTHFDKEMSQSSFAREEQLAQVEAIKSKMSHVEKINVGLEAQVEEFQCKITQSEKINDFIDFTKSLHKTENRPDVEFVFPKREAPESCSDAGGGVSVDSSERRVKAHSLVLCHYSSEFKSLLDHYEKENEKTILVPIENWNYAAFTSFIKGIYWGFTDVTSRRWGTKELFDLAQEYKISRDITQNLFTTWNIWEYLEHALVHSGRDAVLWQKCNRMLTINREIYKGVAKKGGRKLSKRAMSHILALPQSPLTRALLMEMVENWCDKGDGNNNVDADAITEIQTAASHALLKPADEYAIPLLLVQSVDVPDFTIKHCPNSHIRYITEQAAFVTNLDPGEMEIHHGEDDLTKDEHSRRPVGEVMSAGAVLHLQRVIPITVRDEDGVEEKISVKPKTPVRWLKWLVVKDKKENGKPMESHKFWLRKGMERLDDSKLLSMYNWKKGEVVVVERHTAETLERSFSGEDPPRSSTGGSENKRPRTE